MDFIIILVMIFIVWKAFKWAYRGTRLGCLFGVHNPDMTQLQPVGWYDEETICLTCGNRLERPRR